MASASKRKKSKKKNTMESAAFQRDEIILWVVLAFSIILCLSNFGIGGSVGNKLSSVFFGLFGLVSYIFPIGLVLLTAFGLSNKGNKVAWLKVGASILFLMLLCLFMELTISGSAKDTAAAAFTYGKEHKSGGGFFGKRIGASGAAVQPGLCRKLCGHSGQAAPDSFSAVGVYLL